MSRRIDGSLLRRKCCLADMMRWRRQPFSCCKRKEFIGAGLSRKGINEDMWREVLVTAQMFSIALLHVFLRVQVLYIYITISLINDSFAKEGMVSMAGRIINGQSWKK